jgi:hypothetical protein
MQPPSLDNRKEVRRGRNRSRPPSDSGWQNLQERRFVVREAAIASTAYSRESERRLMQSIFDNCGRRIAKATCGDATRNALLAAIAANESGGRPGHYRFSFENYGCLLGLLKGDASGPNGLTRRQLEKRLREPGPETESGALLKKLAGLYGYTQIPGYYSIVWNASLEALMEEESHFSFAAALLDRICRQFHLDPETQTAAIGRCWNAGHASGRASSALYSWRLVERMKLYRGIEESGA